MISLLIATKNRPNCLLACLKSVARNNFSRYEVWVVDQSDKLNPRIGEFIETHPRFRLVRAKGVGKTMALERAFSKSRGNIIAFTDDDCVVAADWLEIIDKSFKTLSIDALVGQVFPYQSKRHDGEVCPCTIHFSKKEEVRKPRYHATIGYGNNMAFRREALEEIGGFRRWLGPGSVGKNADDADVMLRLLLAGKLLVREPKMKVDHNRWLTQTQIRKQEWLYAHGEATCYGFYALHGYSFAWKVLRKGLRLRTLDAYLRGLIVAFAHRFFIS